MKFIVAAKPQITGQITAIYSSRLFGIFIACFFCHNGPLQWLYSLLNSTVTTVAHVCNGPMGVAPIESSVKWKKENYGFCSKKNT